MSAAAAIITDKLRDKIVLFTLNSRSQFLIFLQIKKIVSKYSKGI